MNITQTQDNITVLTPDEGKYLTNGEVYSTGVYLGKNDSAENWTEIDEQDVPAPEPTPEEELEDMRNALGILGVN